MKRLRGRAQAVVLDQRPASKPSSDKGHSGGGGGFSIQALQEGILFHQGPDKPISQPLTSTRLLIGPHEGESPPPHFVTSTFATEKGGDWLRRDPKSCRGNKM